MTSLMLSKLRAVSVKLFSYLHLGVYFFFKQDD